MWQAISGYSRRWDGEGGLRNGSSAPSGSAQPGAYAREKALPITCSGRKQPQGFLSANHCSAPVMLWAGVEVAPCGALGEASISFVHAVLLEGSGTSPAGARLYLKALGGPRDPDSNSCRRRLGAPGCIWPAGPRGRTEDLGGLAEPPTEGTSGSQCLWNPSSPKGIGRTVPKRNAKPSIHWRGFWCPWLQGVEAPHTHICWKFGIGRVKKSKIESGPAICPTVIAF